MTDGRLEIDNNIAENGMRLVALGRKNYLFAGSDPAGVRAASIYTLVQTARLNVIAHPPLCQHGLDMVTAGSIHGVG